MAKVPPRYSVILTPGQAHYLLELVEDDIELHERESFMDDNELRMAKGMVDRLKEVEAKHEMTERWPKR